MYRTRILGSGKHLTNKVVRRAGMDDTARAQDNAETEVLDVILNVSKQRWMRRMYETSRKKQVD